MAKVKGYRGPCNEEFNIEENCKISIRVFPEKKVVNAALTEPVEFPLMRVDSGNLVKVMPVKKEEVFKSDITPVGKKTECVQDEDKFIQTKRVINSSANQNNAGNKPVERWTELNTIRKPESSYKYILPKDIFDDERPLGKTMWVCLTDLVNDNNLMQAEELIATDIRKINRIPKSTFQYEKVAEKRYYEIREVLLERERITSRQNPVKYAKEVRSKILFSEKQKISFLDMVGNPYKDGSEVSFADKIDYGKNRY